MPATATTKKNVAADKPKKDIPNKSKKVNPYNLFMKTELARLKLEDSEVDHKTRFKQAASNWGESKENPKNK